MVLVSALVVSAAAEVVLALVAAAEVLAGAEAVAEAVAEADALADAEELELVPELPPQATRPSVVARPRDKIAIDFFTNFPFSDTCCVSLHHMERALSER